MRTMTAVLVSVLALVEACGGGRPATRGDEPPAHHAGPAAPAAPAEPAVQAAPAASVAPAEPADRASTAAPKWPRRQRMIHPSLLEDPSGVSPTSRDLARSLAEVEMFALGGIGYAGVTSRGEELTLALSREPDAVDAFTWLARVPEPAPRLYAYWALRTLDPARAATLAARLRKAGGEVARMSGCIGYREPVADTLAELDRNAARRSMPRP